MDVTKDENLITNNEQRSLSFRNRKGNRYWWYWQKNYVPPIFIFLNDDEWRIIDEWYRETDEKKLAAEMNIPPICVIQGFIMGSNISNIVQLGHNAGYSTLLIGFMLRKMGIKDSFISIDRAKMFCDYTQKWIERAGLGEYVRVEHGDSSDPIFVKVAKKHFKGAPKFVIIDSSHQFKHTLRELALWYENLIEGGFIILHDSSEIAKTYDATKRGGVKRALQEFLKEKKGIQHININSNSFIDVEKNIYQDGCGLGIIQKMISAGDILDSQSNNRTLRSEVTWIKSEITTSFFKLLKRVKVI